MVVVFGYDFQFNYPVHEEVFFYCCPGAETISYSWTKGLSSHD